MFEAVEVNRRVPKKEYERAVPELRVGLIRAQYELLEADFPAVVLLSGDDTLGITQMLNSLNQWLDPRSVFVYVLDDEPADCAGHRPRFWKYWTALPARGHLGIFVGGWSLEAILDRLRRRLTGDQFTAAIDRNRRFERALTDDGTLLVKFWLHVRKDDLRKRLQRAAADPRQAWMVHERDRIVDRYPGRARRLAEEAITRTDSEATPWHIIEGTNWRHRNLAVGRTLLDAIRTRLSAGRPAPQAAPHESRVEGHPQPLADVDLSRRLPGAKYRRRLEAMRARVNRLTRQARDAGITSVLVFEGWDAAGKGGVIRRLASAMDPSLYRVIPISAPDDAERGHHYLWRFWRHLPPEGRVAIFDRSWYGRVMVERVEGLASREEWRRAYDEINEFEDQIVAHGFVLLKFWLHIDQAEQLGRFEARENTAFKTFKITEEDYRNRSKWDDYEIAVNDMVSQTSSASAPWHLVAANDKRWARITVMDTFARQLARRM